MHVASIYQRILYEFRSIRCIALFAKLHLVSLRSIYHEERTEYQNYGDWLLWEQYT